MEVRCIDGPAIEKDVVIRINALGMINSKREAEDMYTYFGTSEEDNDIVCKDEQIYPKHFYLKYKERRIAYAVRDLGETAGTFVQV